MPRQKPRAIESFNVGQTVAKGSFEGSITEARRNRAGRWQYLIRWYNRPGVVTTWTWHSDITAIQNSEPPFMWRILK